MMRLPQPLPALTPEDARTLTSRLERAQLAGDLCALNVRGVAGFSREAQ